eukprot:SM000070S21366  [mRNA]  locus=s70:649157:650136:- [translate_table: standard]
MFFFLASVAPEVRAVLARSAAACPRCGAPADAVELQQVLRVFALPVWRWGRRRGLACPACGLVASVDPDQLAAGQWPPRPPPPLPRDAAMDLRCPSCGASLAPNFKYCPHCGKPRRFTAKSVLSFRKRPGCAGPHNSTACWFSSNMQPCCLLLAAAMGQLCKCGLIASPGCAPAKELKAGLISCL